MKTKQQLERNWNFAKRLQEIIFEVHLKLILVLSTN